MNVTTCYVGQGAMAVVRHGGEAVIIDSLFPDFSGAKKRPIENTLNQLVAKHTVPGLVLTSFDDDHACPDGIDFILTSYTPNWIMYPKYYKDTDNAGSVFDVIEKHERKRKSTAQPLRRISVRLDRVDSRRLSGLSACFEYELFSPHIEDMDNSNNSGIVLKLSGIGATGFSYLVTGDTENSRWETINKLFGSALKSAVMAAPHHGSKNGANAETILLVEPNTVLISAGVDNQYDHPDSQAVAAYARVAKHVHATNIQQGVSLYTKQRGSDFETELVN